MARRQSAAAAAHTPPPTAAVAPSIPLGPAIDRIFVLRAQKTKVQRQLDAVNTAIETAEAAVLVALDQAKLESAKGKRGQATISHRSYPTMEDYDLLIQHIKKTGAFELLQRRLSATAVRERWDQKQTVPGVGVFRTRELALTAVKAKVP